MAEPDLQVLTAITLQESPVSTVMKIMIDPETTSIVRPEALRGLRRDAQRDAARAREQSSDTGHEVVQDAMREEEESGASRHHVT